MNIEQKKAKKNLKRKRKVQAMKKAELPKKIEAQRMKNANYRAYKQKIEDNKRAINLELKRALGIPDEEEVSTEKLVKAMNLRAKMEKEKRQKEAENQSA